MWGGGGEQASADMYRNASVKANEKGLKSKNKTTTARNGAAPTAAPTSSSTSSGAGPKKKKNKQNARVRKGAGPNQPAVSALYNLLAGIPIQAGQSSFGSAVQGRC